MCWSSCGFFRRPCGFKMSRRCDVHTFQCVRLFDACTNTNRKWLGGINDVAIHSHSMRLSRRPIYHCSHYFSSIKDDLYSTSYYFSRRRSPCPPSHCSSRRTCATLRVEQLETFHLRSTSQLPCAALQAEQNMTWKPVSCRAGGELVNLIPARETRRAGGHQKKSTLENSFSYFNFRPCNLTIFETFMTNIFRPLIIFTFDTIHRHIEIQSLKWMKCLTNFTVITAR